MSQLLMCPVCRARFRGATQCSRCGADLTMVMVLVASAWRMRQSARRAIADEEFVRAQELATKAQNLCYTSEGRKLQELGSWLAEEVAPPRLDGCIS